MITGFEKITRPISNNEIEIAEYVFDVLKENENVNITNQEIADFIENRGKFNSSRIRAMVHYIRVNLCHNGYVIATRNGYCYTCDKGKIEDYIKSLSERINSQQEIYKSCVGVFKGLTQRRKK